MTAPHTPQPDATGHPEGFQSNGLLFEEPTEVAKLGELAIGDLVGLRSGGPAMTVVMVAQPDAIEQWVVAAWFHGTQYLEGQFDPRVLRRVERPA